MPAARRCSSPLTDQVTLTNGITLAGDVFRITDAWADAAPGGGFVISWQSDLGRLYTMRMSADLHGGFGDLPEYTDVPATGGVMTYTNTVPVIPGQCFVLTVRLAE